MKRILIISFSKIASDPRVLRQISALKDCADITVMGFGPSPDASLKYIRVIENNMSVFEKAWLVGKLALRRYASFYWSRRHIQDAKVKLSEIVDSIDYVIANDLDALPLAFEFSPDVKVVYDAHEYSPKEYADILAWRLFMQPYNIHLCSSYLKRTYKMSTVSKGIVDAYASGFPVAPVLVVNASRYADLQPSSVPDNQIRLVHHGAAIPSRHLELMIEMMKDVDDRFTLDFMLVRMNTPYGRKLQRLAADSSRIRFVEPVPIDMIIPALNQYDVGVYLLEPINFNHAHALPNKFFEYVQARLAVAIGPSLEMSRYVKAYNFGVVSDDFSRSSLATCLNAMTRESVSMYKDATNNAAKELSFESTCVGPIRGLFDIVNSN